MSLFTFFGRSNKDKQEPNETPLAEQQQFVDTVLIVFTPFLAGRNFVLTKTGYERYVCPQYGLVSVGIGAKEVFSL